MNEQGYILRAADILRLRKVLDWFEGAGGNGGRGPSLGTGVDSNDDAGWGKITATSGSTPATYTIRLQRSGGSGAGGLQDVNTIDWTGENLWEGFTGGKAGYQATSVTGLRVIPVGSFVRCYWANKSGTRKLVFSERNEPICS